MKQILIVDDDTSVLQFVSKALAEYQPVIAHDGVQALLIAERMPSLDLLITDYLMPSIQGDELIGRLRAKRPELKVLIITGHGDIFDAENPPWWAGEAHLAKPFRPESLRDMVRELLGPA
jgi:DNA-binding NtrC family response regulator